MKITISDESGIVVLSDNYLQLAPQGERREAISELRALAGDGRIFFLDREDPIQSLTIELCDTDPVTVHGFPIFRLLGANFLLRVPSGKLAVSGLAQRSEAESSDNQFQLIPGAYLVSVFGRDDPDMEAYEDEVIELVGRKKWDQQKRADTAYLLGCFPTVLAVAVLVVASWSVGMYFVLAALVLWIPYCWARFSKQYTVVSGAVANYERSLADVIIHLTKVDATEGLKGGYLR